MTFVIASACIDVKDQSCIEVCPVDCIHVDVEDRMCYIHPIDCINCSVCVEACPVAAIYDEKDLSPEDAVFQKINADWFSDRAAARAAIDAIKAP